jgi:hypothetical protein
MDPTDDDALPAHQKELQGLAQQAEACIAGLTSEVDDMQEALYPDIASWMEASISKADELAALSAGLKGLDALAAEVAGVLADPPFETEVPPASESTANMRRGIRIWQLGFRADLSIKGSSHLHAIMSALTTNIVGKGNNTELHPLDVLYTLDGSSPGDRIQDFSVGISNGTATVQAAFLFSIAAMKLNWLDADGPLATSPGVRVAVAKRLLACTRMMCVYRPATSMVNQIQHTLTDKFQAAARSRPTTMQMLAAPVPQLSEKAS